MRFSRVLAVVLMWGSGAFFIFSSISFATLAQGNATNIERWNTMAIQTTDNTERVFFQLQILEIHILQIGTLLQLSLSGITFLLSAILLSMASRRESD